MLLSFKELREILREEEISGGLARPLVDTCEIAVVAVSEAREGRSKDQNFDLCFCKSFS